MDTTDFKRTLPGYQARSGTFSAIDLEPQQYLMIDGHGDPNSSPEFRTAVEALYPLAYALKFISRDEFDRNYVVPPLEGLWSAADMDSFTSARDKSEWDFTLMLLVPDWLSADDLDRAVEVVERKKSPARLGDVRMESLTEGTCVQTLHIGPFDDEGPVLERMHAEVIPELGFALSGLHHEIYLSDFRRAAPEKLRTILRQPVVSFP